MSEVKVHYEMSSDDYRDMLTQMKSLLEHRGWKHLCELMQLEYRQTMAGMIASPLGSADDVFRQEYLKGRMASCIGLCVLPETLIDTYAKHIELEARAAELKEEDEDNDFTDDNDSGW